jgi:uncharacterized membrane protein
MRDFIRLVGTLLAISSGISLAIVVYLAILKLTQSDAAPGNSWSELIAHAVLMAVGVLGGFRIRKLGNRFGTGA